MTLIRHTWSGFLNRHRRFDTSASLLATIGGDSPGRTRARIHAAFKQGKFDKAGLETRLEALKTMASAYMTPVDVDMRDPVEWETCNNGNHRRDLLDPLGLEAPVLETV